MNSKPFRYKRTVFWLVFLLMTGVESNDGSYARDCQQHQSKEKEDRLAEKNPAKTGQNEEPPPVIFIPFTQTVPPAVLRVKDNSLVAITGEIPRLGRDQRIFYGDRHVVGFVPEGWDGHVVTVLHLLGDFPAVWMDEKYFPAVIKILDGQHIFSARAIYIDSNSDLVLLQVDSPNTGGNRFNRKPAWLAKQTFSVDPLTKEVRVPFERFYDFSFFIDYPLGFFTLQLGPYWGITNVFGHDVLKVPMGYLQGASESGFSGSPLLAPNGMVMGVVSETSPAYTYVVLLETLRQFLDDAKKSLAVDPAKARVKKE